MSNTTKQLTTAFTSKDLEYFEILKTSIDHVTTSQLLDIFDRTISVKNALEKQFLFTSVYVINKNENFLQVVINATKSSDNFIKAELLGQLKSYMLGTTSFQLFSDNFRQNTTSWKIVICNKVLCIQENNEPT